MVNKKITLARTSQLLKSIVSIELRFLKGYLPGVKKARW